MHEVPPFHLAFPVASLGEARAFYGGLLGCPEGRSSDAWVDFDFHGHQIVAHLAPEELRAPAAHDVDGDAVPVRHFGVVLSMADWQALADKLREAGTHFVVEPHVRFRGQPGEQATMFLLDPSGNALLYTAFAEGARLFAGCSRITGDAPLSAGKMGRAGHRPGAPTAVVAQCFFFLSNSSMYSASRLSWRGSLARERPSRSSGVSLSLAWPASPLTCLPSLVCSLAERSVSLR
jgi:extradiol dioxygenase family protein